MKILIAGFGSIGRRHFRNLAALGEDDIFFLRSGRSTLPDEEIDRFPVETDLNPALERQPEAVIVANPTALHMDVAIPAAKAGCHLFLEKPISHSLDGLDDLENAVKQGGGQVLMGFQFRFHPGLQVIKDLLSNEDVGEPLSVRVHWGEYLPDWHPWEDFRKSYSARKDLGGGVVLTLCHPLDYLRWLLGEVQALWAFLGTKSALNLDVDDVAEIGLRFDNGVIGSIHLDYHQRPAAHRLEIVCSRGTIRWDNASGVVEVYDPDIAAWKDYPPPDGFERNHLFLAEMEHFLKVIRGQEDPVCDLRDGVQSLVLALGIHESAQSGKLITW